MPPILTDADRAASLLCSEIPTTMAKATLSGIRKAESPGWRKAVGGCVRRARLSLDWNLDEFARRVDRDPRQVAKWEDGTDRLQLDTILAVKEMIGPLLVQLAGLNPTDIDATTVITVRKTA